MGDEPLLYKVSAPRKDLVFEPTPFWHTEDFESSSTRPHDGYIQEDLLYAGDFDEVNIHLFPRVKTARVRSLDADPSALAALGVRCTPGKTAWIFVNRLRRAEVESFRPTIFTFHAHGFVRVRNGEYVSRRPQKAIQSETIGMTEAVERWNIEACYVDDLDSLVEGLRHAGIYCEVQT